ncbi:TetR/AcrR family transcriptional regulator [Streptomyces tsukubensis]|uniref:TetR family transcriptional regulator n=1 Tax=Streptomyces tsukubensis TaxID=83656 RepID=A0A1V4ADC7_9ACTN|nr:TetR/AcrR family transcriptional regulator [Streptomyces tsukubensis]OON81588.1 TetR family transcriptional regulator [Streptomyces tsukubensis]QFR96360.1 TetR family transcriptional regulator [Streptomyces tsukubensis]
MTLDPRALRPRKQPRQHRAELTRQRILVAAARVFSDYGYAAGTTNRIAQQAHISIGSLYQYYPNKDAILVELLMRHLDEGAIVIGGPEGEDPGDSLVDVIRAHVRAAIANHHHDPHLLRVMFEQAPRSPELSKKIAEREREVVAYVQEWIEGSPQARVEDTYVAARLVVSTVGAVVHQLLAAPDAVDPARLENGLVTMLTSYLTADPRASHDRPPGRGADGDG